MKFQVTKEWCKRMADIEAKESAPIAAGSIPMEMEPQEVVNTDRLKDESRIAFGRFIQLNRRKHAMSVETLADKVDVEVGEIISIEDDLHYFPEARTVYQLAEYFDVSQQRLLELSGLKQPKDVSYIGEAVRYAARSESIASLSADEEAALNGLISVLSER